MSLFHVTARTDRRTLLLRLVAADAADVEGVLRRRHLAHARRLAGRFRVEMAGRALHDVHPRPLGLQPLLRVMTDVARFDQLECVLLMTERHGRLLLRRGVDFRRHGTMMGPGRDAEKTESQDGSDDTSTHGITP